MGFLLLFSFLNKSTTKKKNHLSKFELPVFLMFSYVKVAQLMPRIVLSFVKHMQEETSGKTKMYFAFTSSSKGFAGNHV